MQVKESFRRLLKGLCLVSVCQGEGTSCLSVCGEGTSCLSVCEAFLIVVDVSYLMWKTCKLSRHSSTHGSPQEAEAEESGAQGQPGSHK